MAEGADGPENLVLRYLRSIDGRLERVEDKQLEHDREFAHMRGSFAAMRGDLVRLEVTSQVSSGSGSSWSSGSNGSSAGLA